MNLLDWIVTINAAFLFGITLMTFAEYYVSRRITHIIIVAGSHLILTLLVSCSIVFTVFVTKYKVVATVAALVAFAMSDYAVLWMLRHRHQNSHPPKK